jgi:hypothetical protein
VDRLGPGFTLAITAVALLLIRFGRLGSRWSALENGTQIRIFVVFLSAVLSWSLATFGYNYYYDQGYVLERVLLVMLVPLLYLRPLFIYPFLIIAYAMLWQIDQPALSAGAALQHKTHLLRVLELFAAGFLAHAITGTRSTRGVVFLTCCIVAVMYWFPAMSKWQLDWLSQGHLYRMPLAAHAHGWLAGLEPSEVVNYARNIAPFDTQMLIFVLVAESLCLFFLWRKWLAIALLSALSLFHLGVFAMYGYLFWTWIVLNLLLIALLISDRTMMYYNSFGSHWTALGALLIVLGSFWTNPSMLGWYDTRLSYTYRYEVTGTSGARYILPMRFFEPYGDVFTMANFGYLQNEHRMLVFPYGITSDKTIAAALDDARTSKEVFALEQSLGRERHDPDRAAQFYRFVVRYLENFNARGKGRIGIELIGPPPQFWSSVVRKR